MAIVASIENGKVISVTGYDGGGDNSPNWSSVKNAPVLPFNDYHRREVKTFTPIGTVEELPGNYTYNDFPLQFSSPPSLGGPHAEAIKHMYSRIGNVDLQMLVSAAEMPKTLDLVAGTARNIGHAFRRLRKFDVVGAMKHLGINDTRKGNRMSKSMQNYHKANSRVSKKDVAGSRWLELQYGWLPLLGEVESSVKVLNREIENKGMILSFKSNGGTKGTSVVNNYYGSGTRRWKRKIQYYVTVEVIDSKSRTVGSLGLTNPLSVVWELVPYSFVVDWFLPIGDFIAAQTALAGLQYRAGGYSEETITRTKAHVTHVKYSRWATCPANLTLDEHEVWYRRTKMSDFPNATRMLSLSSVHEALGLRRATSALALLNNAFFSRR